MLSWPEVPEFEREAPAEYATARMVLADVAATLADPALTGEHPTIVTVVLGRD